MSETSASAGARLRAALEAERPLQLVGTRTELYDVLGYHQYEMRLDQLFGKSP